MVNLPSFRSSRAPLFAKVLVIAQLFPSESAEALLQRESPVGLDVRQQMVLAFVINGVWLPVFNNEAWTYVMYYY
jgi:hypothetical protein